MARINLGDVFKLKTEKGFAYFQFVFDDPETCQLIRVLPGLFLEQNDDIASLVNKEHVFFLRFAIKGALKRKSIEKVGNYPIPSFVKLPEFMRSVHKVGSEFLGWHITDIKTWKHNFVEKLTQNQRTLSPLGIWGDALLIERLAEGWTPEKEAQRYS